jgi:hypothetical protein
MDLDNALANSYTHCQAAPANAQYKLGKECAYPTAPTERHSEQTNIDIPKGNL